MGKWLPDSRSYVASMSEGDFFGSEQSVTVSSATDVRIEHVDVRLEAGVPCVEFVNDGGNPWVDALNISDLVGDTVEDITLNVCGFHLLVESVSHVVGHVTMDLEGLCVFVL